MSISSLSNTGAGKIMNFLSSSRPESRIQVNLALASRKTQDTTVDQLTSKTSGTDKQTLQDPTIEALEMEDVLVSRHLAQGGSPALQLRSPMGPLTVDMTRLFR